LLQHIDDSSYLDSRYAAYCDLVANGDVIQAAFRAKLLATPDELPPVPRSLSIMV